MNLIKPTIINARKSTIGNLVFLTGELQLPTTVPLGGISFDFSDHVKRILSFDFITGLVGGSGKVGDTKECVESMATSNPLLNSNNDQVRRLKGYIYLDNSAIQGSLLLSSDANSGTCRIIKPGEGHTNGTHSNVVLTGLESGANSARAEVTVQDNKVTPDAVKITTKGSGYFQYEKIAVATPGGSGLQILAHVGSMHSADVEMIGPMFPVLMSEHAIRLVNIFSDSGNGGTLNDSTASGPTTQRICEFTLIGKR